MEKRTLLSSGILVMALILIGKVMALGKDVAISAAFGSGVEMDAFFLAFNTSAMIFAAFLVTITVAFLPLYNDEKEQTNIKMAAKYSSSVLNIFLLISAIITLMVFLFSSEIISIIDLSAEPERSRLAGQILKIMVLSYGFSTFVTFLSTIQLSNDQYFYIHLIPIINNIIVVLAVIFLAGQMGIFAPTIFGVLAWIFQFPLHLWAVRNFFRYRPKIEIPFTKVKKIAIVAAPAFLGALVDQVGLMVSTVLASKLDVGAISAVNYANKLITLASGTFVVAIMTLVFPLLSKHAAKKDIRSMNVSIRAGVRLIVLVMVPITLIILFFHATIVSIVFERGAFDEQSTKLTSPILFFYAFGLLFLGLRELFNKAFYALKNTKTPLFISLFSVAINVVLSYVLIQKMGVKGLALAMSISVAVYVMAQLVILGKMIGGGFLEGISFFLARAIGAGALAGVTLFVMRQNVFNLPDFFALSFASGLAIGVYIGALYLFKIEEIFVLRSLLTSRKR